MSGHDLNSDHVATPPVGGVFRIKAEVLGADDIRRAVTRIAHEILERNKGLDNVVLVGLQRGGVWIAQLLAETISRVEPGTNVPVGAVDVSMYRDDIGLRPVTPGSVTDIPVDLDGRVVVLVDDVLFTGRTVRAALDALNEYGRPRMVQLAVLIDRGHRELPIRPDFVGKNLPSSSDEDVRVTPDGVVIGHRETTGEAAS
ncbi:MAG: bifunctional pyr operon transcriptional regulator/uracil phosphoribosyltransferase PyrR [Actinomycetota bacterium]|jgi:pyrimidine operon attenuation protein/uracil phosphoribosyltransferase